MGRKDKLDHFMEWLDEPDAEGESLCLIDEESELLGPSIRRLRQVFKEAQRSANAAALANARATRMIKSRPDE